MASLASSSRATLARTSSLATSSSSVLPRRHFASSSRAQGRQVCITVASYSARFTLPSLSSMLEPLLPATVSHEPALAGMPVGLAEDGQGESEDVLAWDGVLNAVPKSKVSHSRKAMRAANKGLKDRVDFVHCAACGKPKVAHHICASCFSHINRAQKASKRQALDEADMKVANAPASNGGPAAESA